MYKFLLLLFLVGCGGTENIDVRQKGGPIQTSSDIRITITVDIYSQIDKICQHASDYEACFNTQVTNFVQIYKGISSALAMSIGPNALSSPMKLQELTPEDQEAILTIMSKY